MGSIKAVILDLDGTIYLGSRLIEGAIDVTTFLVTHGVRVAYMTNSSGRRRRSTKEKLVRFGVEAKEEDIFTSSYCTAMYLREEGIRRVFCVGTHEFADELQEFGVQTSEDDTVSVVVVGMDPQFDYRCLADAVKRVRRTNSRFIVCNTDPNYPTDGGVLMPGCGAIVAAIEVGAGRGADFIAGKPNTYMIEHFARDNGLLPGQIVVVGDRIESDIEMAFRFGCPSILISQHDVEVPATTRIVRNMREAKRALEVMILGVSEMEPHG